MKKIVSFALIVVMLLGLYAMAQAEPFYLEEAGVTIEVPEGMTGQDMSSDGNYALGIAVDADPALTYAYSLAYVEALDGKYIEDLSDEEGAQLVQGISSAIQDPQFDTAEADGYKLLVVASGDGTQLHYISLLGGWLCDVAALRTDGALADEDVKTAAALLLSVQFDGDAEAESEG